MNSGKKIKFHVTKETCENLNVWFEESAAFFLWDKKENCLAVSQEKNGKNKDLQEMPDILELRIQEESYFFGLEELVSENWVNCKLEMTLYEDDGRPHFFLLSFNEVPCVCLYIDDIPKECPDERIRQLLPLLGGRHFFPPTKEEVDAKYKVLFRKKEQSKEEPNEYNFKSWENLKKLIWSSKGMIRTGAGGREVKPSLERYHKIQNFLPDLTYLEFHDCDHHNLEIEGLPNLQTCSFRRCKFSKLEFHGLPKLTVLKFPEPKTDDLLLLMISEISSGMGLRISNCPNLSRIEDLKSQRNLQKFSLEDCPLLEEVVFEELENLIDVKLGVGMDKLNKVSITNCPFLDDLSFLYDLKSLRDFRYHDPCIKAQVLCHTARNDHSFLKSMADEWWQLVEKTKNPYSLVRSLAQTYGSFAIEDWAADLISSLCYSLEKQERKVRVGNEETWYALLTHVSRCQESRITTIFEMVMEYLDEEKWRLPFMLRPLLKTLANLPESLNEWANERADQLLDSLSIDFLRDYGPSVCLFYARMRREDLLRTWLEKLTEPETPRWRDRIHLSLGQWEIERGDLDAPRARLKEMKDGDEQDELLEALARVLAKEKPLEAGELLDQISEEWRQATLSAELAEVPAFTEPAENAYRLLLHMERDSEKLADWVESLIQNNPESELAHEVARTFGPDGGVSPFPKLLSGLLDEELVAKATKENQLKSFREELMAEGEAENFLWEALIERMRRQDLVNEEEAKELLENLRGEKQ